jgi:hypothetical protein
MMGKYPNKGFALSKLYTYGGSIVGFYILEKRLAEISCTPGKTVKNSKNKFIGSIELNIIVLI